MNSFRTHDLRDFLNEVSGINIRSVQEMNKILEEMGLQKHEYGHWHLTDLGEKYSIYKSCVARPDDWKPEIFNLVLNYLINKNNEL